MALPNILLREFHKASISDLTPGKLVKTFSQLEEVAYTILARDAEQWGVHFHFQDGECEGKAQPFFWDNGAYFDESFLKGNDQLYLFAHFEPKNGVPHNATPGTRKRKHNPAQESSTSNPEQARTSVPISKSHSPLRRQSSLHSANKKLRAEPAHPPKTKSAPTKSRPHLVQSLSDSDDSDDEVAAKSACDEIAVQQAPSFSADVTKEQHAFDHAAAMSFNEPRGAYGHRENWNDLSRQYHAKIAHARLIHGVYGTPAAVPCGPCVENALECRVYHPDLKLNSLSGLACGECRLRARTCGVRGTPQKSLSENTPAKRNPPRQSYDPTRQAINSQVMPCHPSPNRPDSGVECPLTLPKTTSKSQHHSKDSWEKTKLKLPSGVMLYCPVDTCYRSKEHFAQGNNWYQHVTFKHPNIDIDQEIQILTQQDVSKTLVLPSAPSRAQHAADYLNLKNDNDYLSPQARQRTAHVRLIHGKYGVSAPKPCRLCRIHKKECRVYHPALVQEKWGQAGSYCGECRNSDQACDLPPRPFAEAYGPSVVHPDPAIDDMWNDEEKIASNRK